MLAFPKENMTGDAMVQAQLEDCFIDALSSEENKQDVLRISLKMVPEAMLAARAIWSKYIHPICANYNNV